VTVSIALMFPSMVVFLDGDINWDVLLNMIRNVNFVWDWDLHFNGVWLLHFNRVRLGHFNGVGLGDMDRVRPVDRHFHFHWVRLLHFHRVWLGNFDWHVVGPGDVNVLFDRYWDVLDDWVRDLLLDVVRHRLGDVDWVWPVDLHFIRDFDLLDNGVWLRDVDFDRVRDSLLDGVWDWLWHMDWDWTVNWHFHRVRHFLLNMHRVWDGHFFGQRDVLHVMLVVVTEVSSIAVALTENPPLLLLLFSLLLLFGQGEANYE